MSDTITLNKLIKDKIYTKLREENIKVSAELMRKIAAKTKEIVLEEIEKGVTINFFGLCTVGYRQKEEMQKFDGLNKKFFRLPRRKRLYASIHPRYKKYTPI